ncbi:MAG TPA: DUF4880 domain-containing protein, partial [Steroidobacteraceae bacterium]|nr:DUF4880 domain-containing protein [Steroidobacteraceae bacterium]
MKASSKEERRARATEEAAAWVVRLDGNSLTAAERLEFVDWLRESPVHVAEMLRVLDVHGSLTEYPWWSELLPAGKDFALAEVIPFHSTETHSMFVPRRRGAWVRRCAVVAGLAAALVAAVALLVQHQDDTVVVRTQPGERRELTLTDGSTVTAAPDTDLRIRMSRDRR